MLCRYKGKSNHTRTHENISRVSRKRQSQRQCCKNIHNQNTIQSDSPFQKIVQNLQQQLQRKQRQNRSLRKRVRQLENKEVQIIQQLDTYRKKDIQTSRAIKSKSNKISKCKITHDQLKQQLQAQIHKLHLKLSQYTKQSEFLRQKILHQQNIQQSTTRRKQKYEQFCADGRHTTCCTNLTLTSKMQALKLSTQIQHLKQKNHNLQIEIQNRRQQSIHRQQAVRSMKKEYQNRYNDLLLQLNRLIRQLK